MGTGIYATPCGRANACLAGLQVRFATFSIPADSGEVGGAGAGNDVAVEPLTMPRH